MEERLQILRFVRDTVSSEHTYPTLARLFGAGFVADCLCWGWLKRMMWQGEPTHFITLTDQGVAALVAEARELVDA